VHDRPANVTYGGLQRLSKYVQRELSLHSELSHPFVIGFKRVFFTEDFLVVVLEYASEGSLARFQWPPSYPQRKPLAMYFFQQLIAAIKYCHAHGIMHRDLKHENTLLHMAQLPSGNRFLALKARPTSLPVLHPQPHLVTTSTAIAFASPGGTLAVVRICMQHV
jgi:serine/threonine protein kinase